MTIPRIRLAIPWLEDAIGDARERNALPALPALSWLLARGAVQSVAIAGWRQWMLARLGERDADAMLLRLSAGPCLAALAGVVAAPGAWACAQPVHLAAAIDHLRLAPLASGFVDAEEIAALTETCNDYWRDQGFELHACCGDTWLLRSDDRIECSTYDPACVAGRNVHDYMPAGLDGARVRSLMNELQMLLHEHPINERRERRRLPAINAVWLWGFGAPLESRELNATAESAARLRSATLRSDDAWMRGLWRIHGADSGPLTEAFARQDVHADANTAPAAPAAGLTELEPATTHCIAVTRPAAEDTAVALVAVETTLLQPLRASLGAAHYADAELLMGARVISLAATARFRFWRGTNGLERWFA